MARDPAFLFYSSDFLTGVADLTMEERGQYITLLCLQHQHGHLSEKTICLSLGYRSVTEIGDVMRKFQQDDQGLYYQHRLEEEIEKRQKYTDSRRLNGVKGGRPKNHMDNHMDNHEESICEPYGKPTNNHTENENINEDTIDIGSKRGGTGGGKKPTVEEISAYCKERDNGIDADTFFNFYEAKGWMIGKNRMKDWKASVRTWENKNGKKVEVPKPKQLEIKPEEPVRHWNPEQQEENLKIIASIIGKKVEEEDNLWTDES